MCLSYSVCSYVFSFFRDQTSSFSFSPLNFWYRYLFINMNIILMACFYILPDNVFVGLHSFNNYVYGTSISKRFL